MRARRASSICRTCRFTIRRLALPLAPGFPMHEVVGLFPTPFMRARRALSEPLVTGLIAHFTKMADRTNSSSPNLVHTAMLKPSDSELLVEVAQVVTPLL